MSTPQQQAPNLILGTAGHIDHGKSTLIKALTGIDPDRLAEEKRRGITIELGFAQLVLPSGRKMGVVDVPGHERFVRHMVAGASGVDVALLVIAADDGIMPQTVEHMAVLELLGVHDAVVALTKTDLVDNEWVEFMTAEITERLASTPFAGAPIVAVSAREGTGLDQLKQAIDDVAAKAGHIKAESSMRMPVDRVFTVKGFGTVVTGTLWSGTAHVGDELVVLPVNTKTQIRSIQMHNQDAESAPAGNRVAMSLRDLSTQDIRPGDFLAAPDAAHITDRFDAEFSYADPFKAGRPLESGTRVHIAHGTREILGRLLLMDAAESIAPGQSMLCQIRLEEPLAVAYGDRFIVRSYSPMHVIGGGSVLDAHPRRRTTLKEGEQDMLEAYAQGDIEKALFLQVELADAPMTAEELAKESGIAQDAVASILENFESSSSVARIEGTQTWYVRPSLLQKLVSSIEKNLMEFHSKNPEKTGMPKEVLKAAVLPSASTALFDAVLARAQQRGTAVQGNGEVSHPKAGAGAHQQQANNIACIMAAIVNSKDTPLDVEHLAQETGIELGLAKRAVGKLVHEGRAVLVDGRYYDAAVIETYRRAVTTFLQAQGAATAAQLKEAMSTSRKYAVPLLEYFDASGLTRREGDLRTLITRKER